MARLSTNRIAWTYTADDGTDYRVAAEAGIVGQAKQGGSAGDTVALAKPASLKMRRVTVKSAAHGSRVVPMYSVGAPIATAGETISLNADTDQFTFTSRGNPLPEGHVIHNVTSQST
jgi:hypothetical protein